MKSSTIRLTFIMAILSASSLAGTSNDTDSERGRWPTGAWERSNFVSGSLDYDKIRELDNEIGKGLHGNIDSMLVIQDGRIVYEADYNWDYSLQHGDLSYPSPPPWDYLNTDRYPWLDHGELHSVQSATKSVMSALVGIAIDRGDLQGLDMSLSQLLPHREIKNAGMANIRLENILTMTLGVEWNEWTSYFNPENDATKSEVTNDWVGYLLDKPVVMEQGKKFNYNSTATQLLSEALTVASGVPTDEYAELHLFGPIGIKNYHWNKTPEGYINAGAGLYLTIQDLARFALLYEQNGMWQGKRVIPEDWVLRSTKPHIPISPADPCCEHMAYGYQWWVFRLADHGAPKMYGGWGWGGQFPIVVPELNLVAVFTGWNIRDDVDYQYAFDLFYDRVVKTAH